MQIASPYKRIHGYPKASDLITNSLPKPKGNWDYGPYVLSELKKESPTIYKRIVSFLKRFI